MPKLVAAAIAAIAAAVLLGLAAESSVAAAKSCHLSAYQQRHLGATYVTSLKVKKVGCSKAKKVIKAYHACRHEHGKGGKCSRKVSGGWKCTEKRSLVIPTQYDADVTCKKGTARIFSHYEQFT